MSDNDAVLMVSSHHDTGHLRRGGIRANERDLHRQVTRAYRVFWPVPFRGAYVLWNINEEPQVREYLGLMLLAKASVGLCERN
jgi:hypothetical protein